MAGEKIAETPLMKQYFQVKAQYPEAVLLFRVGDFYETFSDDALIASKVLGIVHIILWTHICRNLSGQATRSPYATNSKTPNSRRR